MTPRRKKALVSILPGVTALVVITAYLIILLRVENQTIVLVLLGFGIGATVVANWMGWLTPVGRCFTEREDALGLLAIVAAVGVAGYFHGDHFVLLLLCTVLLYCARCCFTPSPHWD
jgi:hypothetical protein